MSGVAREETIIRAIRAALGVGLALLLAGGSAQAAPKWTLMAYLRSAGGLEEAATGYVEQFRAAVTSPQVRVVVQVEVAQRPGWAWRLVITSAGITDLGRAQHGEMNRAATLAQFLRWAAGQAPADHYLLLALAHGRPPVPEVTSGLRRGGELGIGNLADALAADSDLDFDVVFLDCCYTGSVEVADRLGEAARYLVAVPGLLYSPGLPWGQILEELGRDPEKSAQEVSLMALEQTREFWRQRPEVPAGLVVVDLARARELSQAIRELAQVSLPLIGDLAPQITLARGQAPSWGPQGEMVEVSALADTLAEMTPHGQVAAQAQEVSRAARAATVAVWAQGISGSHQAGVGLGIFFPMTLQAWSARYGAGAIPSFAATWEPFLRAYLQSITALAEGGDKDRQAAA